MSDKSIGVSVPALLAHCCGGQRQVFVAGETFRECLADLLKSYPKLRPHLFNEAGEQREHVLFFYDGDNTRWFESFDFPVKAGGRLTILQAVTGG